MTGTIWSTEAIPSSFPQALHVPRIAGQDVASAACAIAPTLDRAVYDFPRYTPPPS